MFRPGMFPPFCVPDYKLPQENINTFLQLCQIHSPWLGDIYDSGIGLSYRLARLCTLASRYDNLLPESTLSPQSGTMNLATDINNICAQLETQ